MLKKIFGTASARFFYVIITFTILSQSSKLLGPENYGFISLFILCLTITQLIADVIGGSPTTYYASRTNPWQVFIPGWSWVVLSTFISFLFFQIISLFPSAYNSLVPPDAMHLILLTTLLSAINNMQMNYLVGTKKIKKYNLLYSLQVLMVLALLLFNILILGINDYFAAIYAYAGAHLLCSIIGFIYLLPLLSKSKIIAPFHHLKKFLDYGWKNIVSNMIALINRRVSYPVISNMLGEGALGVYSAGGQLAEGLRVLSQSIATVQYSELVNSKDPVYNRRITLNLLKITTLITAMGLLVFILIPEKWFVLFLSEKFIGVKPIIVCLSIGVFFYPSRSFLNHYFSGVGQPIYNSITAIIGVCAIIPLFFLLVPAYGIIGFALATSFSQITSVTFQFISFIKLSKATPLEILPNKGDLDMIKEKWYLIKSKLEKKRSAKRK